MSLEICECFAEEKLRKKEVGAGLQRRKWGRGCRGRSSLSDRHPALVLQEPSATKCSCVSTMFWLIRIAISNTENFRGKNQMQGEREYTRTPRGQPPPRAFYTNLPAPTPSPRHITSPVSNHSFSLDALGNLSTLD